MTRFMSLSLVALSVLTIGWPSVSQADTIYRNRDGINNRYDRNRSIRDDDYVLKTKTKNEAGETIRTKTEYEQDRDGYTKETTVRGPDGLIERRKEEVERDNDEMERKITTTGADGQTEVETEKYEYND